MKRCFGACVALALSAGAVLGEGQTSIADRSSLDRYVYPLSKSIRCPRVVVDTKDMPAAAAWGDAARGLVQQWYPVLCQLLGTEGYKAPRELRLVFKPTLSAPAYTEGNAISINGEWITAHPDDLGMVIHELAHVVQSYPDQGPKPGWLVEGIADYIRWWRYEPSPPGPRFSPEATYHDSYRTTAAYLAWVSRHYDQRLVPQLDHAMRVGEDPMPIFEKLTGKTPQALWDEMRK